MYGRVPYAYVIVLYIKVLILSWTLIPNHQPPTVGPFIDTKTRGFCC